MKTNFLILCFAILASVTSLAAGGSEGGAGFVRDGRYLTFGSARVPIQIAKTNVDGLDLLESMISQMPLSQEYRGQLASAMLPSNSKTYYDIAALKPNEQKELIEIYRRDLNIPPSEEVTIYAVTNPYTGETFILPTFYKLQLVVEKAAILFHEGAWIVARQKQTSVTYRQMIEIEVAVQRYLEQSNGVYHYDANLYLKLNTIFGSNLFSLFEAIRDDQREGRLSPFLDAQGELPSEFIFGKETLDYEVFQKTNTGASTQNLLRGYAIEMMKRYPELSTFKALKLFSGSFPLWITSGRRYSGAPSPSSYGFEFELLEWVNEDVRTHGTYYEYPQKFFSARNERDPESDYYFDSQNMANVSCRLEPIKPWELRADLNNQVFTQLICAVNKEVLLNKIKGYGYASIRKVKNKFKNQDTIDFLKADLYLKVR